MGENISQKSYSNKTHQKQQQHASYYDATTIGHPSNGKINNYGKHQHKYQQQHQESHEQQLYTNAGSTAGSPHSPVSQQQQHHLQLDVEKPKQSQTLPSPNRQGARLTTTGANKLTDQQQQSHHHHSQQQHYHHTNHQQQHEFQQHTGNNSNSGNYRYPVQPPALPPHQGKDAHTNRISYLNTATTTTTASVTAASPTISSSKGSTGSGNNSMVKTSSTTPTSITITNERGNLIIRPPPPPPISHLPPFRQRSNNIPQILVPNERIFTSGQQHTAVTNATTGLTTTGTTAIIGSKSVVNMKECDIEKFAADNLNLHSKGIFRKKVIYY